MTKYQIKKKKPLGCLTLKALQRPFSPWFEVIEWDHPAQPSHRVDLFLQV
jgi:hypothetical protein